MFSTRYKSRNNICGTKIAIVRRDTKPFMSQTDMAILLQRAGMDCDRHVVRRVENGQRFVTDIELKIIAKTLGVSADSLLEWPERPDRMMSPVPAPAPVPVADDDDGDDAMAESAASEG